MIVSGANLDLRPSDVQQAESLIAKATVVVCQLEVAPEISLAALKLGKKHRGMALPDVYSHTCSSGLLSTFGIVAVNKSFRSIFHTVP